MDKIRFYVPKGQISVAEIDALCGEQRLIQRVFGQWRMESSSQTISNIIDSPDTMR